MYELFNEAHIFRESEKYNGKFEIKNEMIYCKKFLPSNTLVTPLLGLLNSSTIDFPMWPAIYLKPLECAGLALSVT